MCIKVMQYISWDLTYSIGVEGSMLYLLSNRLSFKWVKLKRARLCHKHTESLIYVVSF